MADLTNNENIKEDIFECLFNVISLEDVFDNVFTFVWVKKIKMTK